MARALSPSSVVTGEALYAVSHGITALAPEKGSVTQLWRNEKLNPGTASPLVLGDHIYVVNGAGVLIKASLKNGDELWKLRMKGPFSGSPVAAGKHIYAVNERGIFQGEPEPQKARVTQEIELKETVLTTPAISGGAIYVRSDASLEAADNDWRKPQLILLVTSLCGEGLKDETDHAAWRARMCASSEREDRHGRTKPCSVLRSARRLRYRLHQRPGLVRHVHGRLYRPQL